MEIQRPYKLKNVTIPDDADGLMDAGVELRDQMLVGLIMPAAWTAAAITFQADTVTTVVADGAYVDVYDDSGNEVSLTVAAARTVMLAKATRDLLEGIPFLRLRSGTTGAAVQQAADRAIGLLVLDRVP